MSVDPDCLFCQIVSGEIPSEIVHSDDDVVAFRDIDPKAPVHVLVVPREHHENAAALAEHRPGSLDALFRTAAAIAAEEQLPGYRTVFNTGSAAQQSVFHAHLHVLGGRDFTWPPG